MMDCPALFLGEADELRADLAPRLLAVGVLPASLAEGSGCPFGSEPDDATMLGLEAPIRARSLATCSEPAREEQARSALGESKEVTRPGSAQL